jgi:PAS domain S-box-containing protein
MPEPLQIGDQAGAGSEGPCEDKASLANSTATVNAINQRIFDTSLDLILVVDRQGNFLRVSPSSRAILGYDPSEMVGRSARLFLYPPDLDSTRNEMRLARRGRVMRNFECRYIHKDGRTVPLSWMGVWSEPEQEHFFIGRDISDREESEKRLRQAQRMESIGQLTGGMAHDFNNLLGIIIGNLDLLRGTGDLDPEQQEFVGDALEAATRGAALTRNLLAFARRQSLRPEGVAINDLVTSTVGLLARTLGEQIPITIDLAQDLWPVQVDRSQLEASLVNLATNARDAMPGGGQLSITTANRVLDPEYVAGHSELVAGDYVMIEVSDSGTGMSPELLARVFEPFFTTKEPGKGTGLGLSMVFGFVKQSGGHINVYSEPGRGTTFRLYLPRESASTDASPQPKPPELVVGGHEAVLLVEDNEGMRHVVRRQLTNLGYRVFEADSSAAALRLLEIEKIDLLLSDIVMPGGMDGVELARTVMTRWPAMGVVLTSGFPEAKLDHNDLDLRILGKPYRRVELAAILRATLDRARNQSG